MDEVKPAKFVLTLFGGDRSSTCGGVLPCEQCQRCARPRGISQGLSLITTDCC